MRRTGQERAIQPRDVQRTPRGDVRTAAIDRNRTARVPRPDASPPRRGDLVRRNGEGWDRGPAHRTADHRWARPYAYDVDTVHVHHPVPYYNYYYPWYTGWWVHPYYRWQHTGFYVAFGWPVYPWVDYWYPTYPYYGWSWVPGYYYQDTWSPGYYEPEEEAPVYEDTQYQYEPGYWIDDSYVDGYWRMSERAGWEWVDAHYDPDGTYAWGYWEPTTAGPEGYVWEPGTWDGETWIEGYWRLQERENYRWVAASWGADGVYRAGYWEPLDDNPGNVWIPGWFDGRKWIEGYWVPEETYEATDPETWQPPQGWDAGRNEEEAPAPPADAGPPVGLPVQGES